MDEPAEPERDEFDEMIARALGRLPEAFAAQLDSVAIVIDEEASPELLEETGVPGLYGLYQGVPRTLWGARGAPFPSKITIFRRPIEHRFRDSEARAKAVEDTLFHEIAHHFGISDARLRELSAERVSRARPSRRATAAR